MSRKAEFLETGARLAAKIGVNNVTRRAIAEAHNVSDPLIGKHVDGGKEGLRKGIKSTMRKLGLSEPADALAKGKALRARKATPAKKSVTKKATAPATKATRTVAKKAKPAKKSVTKKIASSAGKPSTVRNSKPTAGIPADPKTGAPSRKVVKKAPANKGRFPTKAPPLPALPPLPKLP